MKDNAKLEKHFQHHEHNPVERFQYKDMEIFISEGGPYFDNKFEFPLGYYESAYAIGANETILFYMPLIFDYMHEIQMTNDARRNARIMTARNTAIEHIDLAGKIYG
jgi:hypothetical protein